MLEWCKVLLLFKTQGKKKKQNITKQRLGRTYCKAVNHHQRKKKKKTQHLKSKETKQVCHSTGGKAFSLADTGGLCHNDNPVTFPAARVATGAGVTPRQLLCPASTKQRNFVDVLSTQMVLGPALPHFYVIPFQ